MKVGDYVRTKNKGIFKIDERCYFNKDFKEFWFKAPCDYDNEWTTTREVIKSSPNIIDLIEVGDYVNGSKVIDIAQAPKKAIYLDTSGVNLIPVVNSEIHTIITKEQFESMEYKVKE